MSVHRVPDVSVAGAATSALPADLMVHLTATINSNLDLRAVLQVVTDTATRLSGATFGAFFYNAVDEAGSSYRLHVLSGADVEAFTRMPAPRITQLFEPTFTGSSSVRIADVAEDPRFSGMPRGHLPLRSYLSTPVIARDGQTIGALLFGHPEAGVFAEATEDAVRVVAAQAAVAVENARLLAAEVAARQLAEDRAESLELLQEVTSRLATVLNEDDALDALEDTLSRRLGTARMGVYRLEGGAFRALRSKFPGTAHFSLVPWDQPSMGHDAVEQNSTVVVHSRAELAQRYPGVVDRLPGIEAGAAIPLRIEGVTFGALVLTWAHRVDFTANLQRMLAALGEQLAGTLERARLYSAEARAREELSHHVSALTEASQTLQRSLLPDRLPHSEHVEVAVRYLPGAADAEVGGDWYDMVVAPGGRVVLVIGDVQGHSFSAAAVMGRVSTALHAYLLEGHPLDVALRRVNPMVEASGLLVTCCLMSLDPLSGEVQTVRAGHPLPVFSRGDLVGEVGDGEGGPPLGVDARDAEWPISVGQAQTGDRLVLFTDGLVERRGSDTDAQVDELLSVVVAASDLDVEGAADAILERLRSERGDDVALLVADCVGGPPVPSVQLVVEDTAAVREARAFTTGQLEAWELGDQVTSAAELLVSEMVTNALVHAEGPAHLELHRTGAGVRVCVTDQVAHEPTVEAPDPDTDHGRGLLLVEALAARWGVRPSGAGKTVWAEIE